MIASRVVVEDFRITILILSIFFINIESREVMHSSKFNLLRRIELSLELRILIGLGEASKLVAFNVIILFLVIFFR